MRNTCAHYSRVYGRYFTYAPPRYLIADVRKSGIKKNQNETLFARLLAIKNILAYSTKSDLLRWNGFICELSLELSTMENIVRLEKMGFPENWEEMLAFNNNL